MWKFGEPQINGLAERLRRRDGVLAQEAQGQTVLLRMDDGGYYALDDVVTALCAEYDAPRATVAADVLEFVGDLRREHLLVDAA